MLRSPGRNRTAIFRRAAASCLWTSGAWGGRLAEGAFLAGFCAAGAFVSFIVLRGLAVEAYPAEVVVDEGAGDGSRAVGA